MPASAANLATIVLDGGVAEARRALTLVPDHHICIVRADHVVDTMPPGFTAPGATRSQTFVSVPSATDDVELITVDGLHGP